MRPLTIAVAAKAWASWRLRVEVVPRLQGPHRCHTHLGGLLQPGDGGISWAENALNGHAKLPSIWGKRNAWKNMS